MLNTLLPKYGFTAGALSAAWRWWLLAVIVIAADLITKAMAESLLSYGRPWVITPFFNFTLSYNPGAAFSFLAGQGGWQRWFFSIIATVVSVVLIGWIARITPDRDKRLEALALTLILGGALGNLHDRILYGQVVDFIVFHYQHYYFPAFNIADSAICVGAGLLILDTFTGNSKSKSDKNE